LAYITPAEGWRPVPAKGWRAASQNKPTFWSLFLLNMVAVYDRGELGSADFLNFLFWWIF